MSFRREFADKVAEIRRQALDHFQDFGLVRPGSRESIAHLSGDNTRVAPDVEMDQVSLERLQSRLDRILSDLDMFEIRVEQYRDLDREDLRDLRRKLCRRDISHLGGGNWGVSMGPAPDTIERPDNVTDRINIAAYRYVVPAADPPSMQAQPLWEGAAAEAFNSGFLLPFQNVAAWQIFAGVYLGNVLQILENVVKGVQDDLLAIADAVINAFNDDVDHPLGASLSDGALFTDLIGFVLPEPLGTLTDVGSVSLDLLSRQVTDPDPPEWIVQWNLFTEDIIADGFSLLDQLEERILAKDQALGAAIDADSASWDFRMVGATPDPPDRIDQVLVADILSIYEIGKRVLPSAADLYQEAALKVHLCDLPDWFNRPFTICWSYYESARQALHAGLNQSTEHLLNAGQALVDICNGYEFQDAATAAEFESFKEALPPPEDLTPMRGRGSRAHPS